MVGSPVIAAWIAQIAFWSLLTYGLLVGELTVRRGMLFVAAWLIGRVGLPYVPYGPARAMFSSFVAILDIALVFAIFKRDVRLT